MKFYYIIIVIGTVIFLIWYVLKKEVKNFNQEEQQDTIIAFSKEDKLFLKPLKAETAEKRQIIFNESYMRYKKNFNLSLQENQQKTEVIIEEKLAINNAKNEAVQIVHNIQIKKKKKLKDTLHNMAEVN